MRLKERIDIIVYPDISNSYSFDLEKLKLTFQSKCASKGTFNTFPAEGFSKNAKFYTEKKLNFLLI